MEGFPLHLFRREMIEVSPPPLRRGVKYRESKRDEVPLLKISSPSPLKERGIKGVR